jgi:hypothetical protein
MIYERLLSLSKKIIMVIGTIILSSPFTYSAITLTIGDGSGLPGSTESSIEVSLDNSSDKIKGMQLDVCDADDYLSCTSCETTERAPDFSCTTNELANGCCRALLFSPGGDLIDEGMGSILIVKYDVSGNSPEGECRDLNPAGIKVSAETEGIPPDEITSTPGEFCFHTPTSTTTTSIPSNGASIDVAPDPIWKRWILLPRLLVIAGNNTHFKAFNTTVDYQPSRAVLPFCPLILDELCLWNIILVMPSWLAGKEDQTVTVTVTTDSEVVSSDFSIYLLPFFL